jgi:hypothetical protein
MNIVIMNSGGQIAASTGLLWDCCRPFSLIMSSGGLEVVVPARAMAAMASCGLLLLPVVLVMNMKMNCGEVASALHAQLQH